MPRPPASCGTSAGYYRHRRKLKEDACDPCKAAHAAAQAPVGTTPRKPAECGTEGGYKRHRRTLQTEPCTACKAAHNAATSRRWATTHGPKRCCDSCGGEVRRKDLTRCYRCRTKKDGRANRPAETTRLAGWARKGPILVPVYQESEVA